MLFKVNWVKYGKFWENEDIFAKIDKIKIFRQNLVKFG
jgi:hypothetical protein